MALNAWSLITVDELKTHMGIAGAGTDAYLEDVLNDVSDALEDYAGVHLKDHGDTITEILDGEGKGHHKLFPRSVPIGAVTSIHVDQDRVFGAASLVAAGDYVIDQDRMFVELLPSASLSLGTPGTQGFFSWGVQNIQLIYTAGYGAAGAPTVPGSLKRAAKITAARWVKGGDHATLGKGSERIQSQSKGEESVSFRPAPVKDQQLPSAAQKILDRYNLVTVL